MPKFAPELLPQAVRDAFKWEIAHELGMTDEIAARGWHEMSSRDCGRVGGRIGGNMVKVLIRHAQQAMIDGQQS